MNVYNTKDAHVCMIETFFLTTSVIHKPAFIRNSVISILGHVLTLKFTIYVYILFFTGWTIKTERPCSNNIVKL